MFKLIVISIFCFVQIINSDQISSDEVVNGSNYTDAFLLEAVQLFDKLKRLEVATLENIKRLNVLSNEQTIAKNKFYGNYNSQFNNEIKTLQNTVKPKMYKNLELTNCSAETAKTFDAMYADEKSYPNILMAESELEQNKIVTNYTRTIEEYFTEGIEEFKMAFINPESMNKTELTSFSQHFDEFLVILNQKVDAEYRTARQEIAKTTATYETNLDANMTKIKDQMKIVIEKFENCTKNDL